MNLSFNEIFSNLFNEIKQYLQFYLSVESAKRKKLENKVDNITDQVAGMSLSSFKQDNNHKLVTNSQIKNWNNKVDKNEFNELVQDSIVPTINNLNQTIEENEYVIAHFINDLNDRINNVETDIETLLSEI